jgi:hypothetical protein
MLETLMMPILHLVGELKYVLNVILIILFVIKVYFSHIGNLGDDGGMDG